MESSAEEKEGKRSFLSRHKLALGSALYVFAALADIGMTLGGMGGDINLEGNPVMRTVMVHFGPKTGLFLGKAVVGAICFAIAFYGEREIKREADWIWKLPSTTWTKAWMRKGDRSWIAYTPLYAVAISQLLAAASWAVVKAMV
ncbi:MAG: hypothetical protein GTN81_02000 [Proteobacteria bacterium]|nr:hypothetical protein [Pseudomonadota bacterium]